MLSNYLRLMVNFIKFYNFVLYGNGKIELDNFFFIIAILAAAMYIPERLQLRK